MLSNSFYIGSIFFFFLKKKKELAMTSINFLEKNFIFTIPE
jgi:hypothetical protein